jgi:hypothetical protein
MRAISVATASVPLPRSFMTRPAAGADEDEQRGQLWSFVIMPGPDGFEIFQGWREGR